MTSATDYEQQVIDRYTNAYQHNDTAAINRALRDAAEYDRLNPGRNLRPRLADLAFRGIRQD